MKWQLTEPHYINEQVLPTGTIVGDDTPHSYRSNHDDRRIGRKKGDHLPPTNAMRPMDAEAHEVYAKTFPDGEPLADPTQSIPLTGAENSPRVPGVAPPSQGNVAPTPKVEPPKTGLKAEPTPEPKKT